MITTYLTEEKFKIILDRIGKKLKPKPVKVESINLRMDSLKGYEGDDLGDFLERLENGTGPHPSGYYHALMAMYNTDQITFDQPKTIKKTCQENGEPKSTQEASNENTLSSAYRSKIIDILTDIKNWENSAYMLGFAYGVLALFLALYVSFYSGNFAWWLEAIAMVFLFGALFLGFCAIIGGYTSIRVNVIANRLFDEIPKSALNFLTSIATDLKISDSTRDDIVKKTNVLATGRINDSSLLPSFVGAGVCITIFIISLNLHQSGAATGTINLLVEQINSGLIEGFIIKGNKIEYELEENSYSVYF